MRVPVSWLKEHLELGDDVTVSVSHEAAKEWREYERTSSAVVEAYTGPIVRNYLLDLEGRFDVIARIHGGGITGQAGALRLGVARCLNAIDTETNRASLKKAGLLTRDARVIERKKAGLKKARKAPQYSKR